MDILARSPFRFVRHIPALYLSCSAVHSSTSFSSAASPISPTYSMSRPYSEHWDNVCYLTDVEGNLDHFHRYVRTSKGLYWESDGQLVLRDGYAFVYGGDVGDKGLGSLRCMELLVGLKKRYPDRVELLLGNRDINKLRFTSELHEEALESRLSYGAHWIPASRRVTPRDYLLQKFGGTSAETDEEDRKRILAEKNTLIHRLMFMLEKTMGSDGDFERRRQEIMEMQGDSSGSNVSVSEEQVLQSFISSVEEGGIVREYLKLGVLGVHVHDLLFVHGGVMGKYGGETLQDCFGVLPKSKRVEAHDYGLGEICSSGSDSASDTMSAWVENLNSWYRNQLEDWLNRPHFDGDGVRGGEAILNYVLPLQTPTVVLSRHLEPSGNPRRMPNSLDKFLADRGVSKIIVGHTPHGNCPTVIKNARVSVIMADTSYSDMQAEDNRGDNVSEVVLCKTDDNSTHSHIHGYIHMEGRKYEIQYVAEQDEYVGRELENGYWVKAKMKLVEDELKQVVETEAVYLTFSVEGGFKVTYEVRSRTELDEIGLLRIPTSASEEFEVSQH